MQRARPWWMTALAVFCLGSVIVLVSRDLFVPHTRDVEVWFGFEVRGTAARLTAPLHWAVFALGAWGFWLQRPWILPCAAAYELYVAICHLIWNHTSPSGWGSHAAWLQFVLFAIPAIVILSLWRRSERNAATSNTVGEHSG